MKFKNPNHLPGTPKSWSTRDKDGKPHRVEWHPTLPWGSFYSHVVKYSEINNLAVPTMEEVENHVCQQLAQGWCTGDMNYRPPARVPTPCKSCGRR
jgi:hypothetical protein